MLRIVIFNSILNYLNKKCFTLFFRRLSLKIINLISFKSFKNEIKILNVLVRLNFQWLLINDSHECHSNLFLKIGYMLSSIESPAWINDGTHLFKGHLLNVSFFVYSRMYVISFAFINKPEKLLNLLLKYLLHILSKSCPCFAIK